MKGEFFMKNTTHRVVILKNVNSALIEQAILILKDGAEGNETGVMAEAEKVVEKYMNTLPPINYTVSKRTAKIWIVPAVVSAVVSLLAFIKYIM